jgi:hypothetical protein
MQRTTLHTIDPRSIDEVIIAAPIDEWRGVSYGPSLPTMLMTWGSLGAIMLVNHEFMPSIGPISLCTPTTCIAQPMHTIRLNERR